MEFLRKYLTQIKAQLTGLTLSQRLLIALLVVVMIATIFFTVIMSAKTEMIMLIQQPMTAEEINRAEMALKGKYQYTVQGDRILVPVDKAYQIRGELAAVQALPNFTTETMAKMMEDNDYMRTEASNARRWDFARQETLSRILRGFPYLSDAQVIISKGERVGIGRPEVPSSAMVTVKLRGGEMLTGGQVIAIVDMVRGAVAGMRREDVHITDGMRPYSAPSLDSQIPTTQLELKQNIEESLTKKLYTMFSDYGSVKIAVNAVPNMGTEKVDDLKFGKPVKADSKVTHTENTSSDGATGGQPGVSPNTSAVAGVGVGRSTNTSTINDSTTSEIFVDKRQTQTFDIAGTRLSDLTASICLPRSYFVAVYKSQNAKDAKEPDDAALLPLINERLKRAHLLAKNTIGISVDEKIRVDWFDDTVIARADADGGKGPVTASTFASISQYAKQGVLGVVAFGALFMMLMMVRKAVPAASSAGVDADPSVFFGAGGKRGKGGKEMDQLDNSEDVFGEAGEGEAVLTGIELDDETLASRKMVDEVSTMVKENPENAATLIKKWIAKGK
jgi:flagellar biosynthesis/type III secretory pathway M-ring protein FliF/YscJ